MNQRAKIGVRARFDKLLSMDFSIKRHGARNIELNLELFSTQRSHRVDFKVALAMKNNSMSMWCVHFVQRQNFSMYNDLQLNMFLPRSRSLVFQDLFLFRRAMFVVIAIFT